jgi:hypothetical protein
VDLRILERLEALEILPGEHDGDRPTALPFLVMVTGSRWAASRRAPNPSLASLALKAEPAKERLLPALSTGTGGCLT